MYTVLLIEDSTSTGSFLEEYLSERHLERFTDRGFAGGTWWDKKGGTPYESSNDERSAGQLLHLRHGLDTYAEETQCVPRVKWFPQERLHTLAEAARHDHPDERARALLEQLRDYGRFDQMISVVDLALSEDEARKLEACGGRQQVHGTSRRRRFSDPRPTLRKLTGFRIIEALSPQVPIIATTFASNPLVLQHCLVSGAFAIVRKPVEQMATHRFDMQTARTRAIPALELSARRNSNALDVVVVHYGMLIAAEILKAVSARVLSSSDA